MACDIQQGIVDLQSPQPVGNDSSGLTIQGEKLPADIWEELMTHNPGPRNDHPRAWRPQYKLEVLGPSR
jgi:hypothetical protein